MVKALIFIVSAFVFFFTSSCSDNTSTKTVAALNDSMHGDTLIIKDSVSALKQNLFYPDSSADTNLVFRSGNVSVYDIKNSGGCDYNYDCVVKLSNGTYKSFNLWDDNMIDLDLDFDSIMVQELDINGRGNKEFVINIPVEGHHLYGGDFMGLGDEEDGGWSYNYNWVDVWDIDEMRVLFHCEPYAETWEKQSREDKSYFSFYRYDFNITPDNKIILSNPMKKIKDKIMPSKAKKLDVRMGTYQFQNDSFVWVSYKK